MINHRRTCISIYHLRKYGKQLPKSPINTVAHLKKKVFFQYFRKNELTCIITSYRTNVPRLTPVENSRMIQKVVNNI